MFGSLETSQIRKSDSSSQERRLICLLQTPGVSLVLCNNLKAASLASVHKVLNPLSVLYVIICDQSDDD